MALVAYGSSDSEAEETSSLVVVPEESRRSTGGLFSLLPAPKSAASNAPTNEGSTGKESKSNPPQVLRDTSSSNDGLESQPSKGGLLFNLPKPKKRTEPVKITIPQIKRADSDSDDDEPVKKKLQPQGPGTGLSSLLPQPKNMTVKEINRPLVPHTLTKRVESKGPKPVTPAQSHLGSSASPSAIKAAAKSAALQLARQIATDDQDNDDDDVAPENYFSLGDSSQSLPAVVPSPDPEPAAPASLLPLVPGPDSSQSNAPLDFGGNQEGASSGTWGYQQTVGPSAYSQGYYNDPYYQDPDEEPASTAMFDDEAFMRLQGKRNRSKEEVKFLEIKGDDQLSGNQQWMAKSMTEEKQERKSFSKKKGEQPTGQQRRKHQITYLIHQAKERELELKNNWAENKLTRRQTQAKYGF